jgi:tRNA 2-thiouridine synthesizing protein A
MYGVCYTPKDRTGGEVFLPAEEEWNMGDKAELDARGLVCPMPIIKLSKIVKAINPGDTLEVRADDPAFESDVTTWCQKMGHSLVSVEKDGTDLVALIEKK